MDITTVVDFLDAETHIPIRTVTFPGTVPNIVMGGWFMSEVDGEDLVSGTVIKIGHSLTAFDNGNSSKLVNYIDVEVTS